MPAAHGTPIYWGGFGFAGNAEAVANTYPIAYQMNTTGDPDLPRLHAWAREQVQGLGRMNGADVIMDAVAPGNDALVVALALGDERILVEAIGDRWKVVIRFGFELLLIDFRDMKLVASRPFDIEYIDNLAHPPTPEHLINSARRMTVGDLGLLSAGLTRAWSGLRVSTSETSTLRVRTVAVAPEAHPFLPGTQEGEAELLGTYLARRFTSLLADRAGVAVLPFAKDNMNAAMSLVFADQSMVQFSIPEPTYALDLVLVGFRKAESKKTPAETLWIYGAFLDGTVVEPAFGGQLAHVSAAFAVPKVLPKSQRTVDEYPVVLAALDGAILNWVEKVSADRRHRKILEKCRL